MQKNIIRKYDLVVDLQWSQCQERCLYMYISSFGHSLVDRYNEINNVAKVSSEVDH